MKKTKTLCIAITSLALITVGLFFVSTLKRSQKVTEQVSDKPEVVSETVTLTATADVTIEK
ncbi:MAG: hypothetical protein A3C06_00840 [Candidatus Taylorbacteria bacterium RIFCSPHIGHO2_02_FULL_46_13]|uniref:Uncharacterized protein n=1 Tax=Candidatus Taylorbacteria bacterium RIFCSPHIGHO2_02_FULL_46_13 TaxID=1802312 RepID=A0A1G2MSV2_9BACT|nr:MAG: hypothetical protein A3C06_00840 [Candidatus Taylorbacteria bacterium RIFCSPHIGHO2_02_FULL_46_13]